jgi:RNA polymerase sigma-70 factor (ECF subfamily)
MAEDVYQEISMILARDPEAIPDDEGVVPWLREMTRRKSLEWGRKHRRMPQLLDEQILCQVAEEVAVTERSEELVLKEQLEQCLGKMTKQQQDILYGRYNEGASGEELAERSGRTVQAVYAILKRARIAIERCVQQKQAQA